MNSPYAGKVVQNPSVSRMTPQSSSYLRIGEGKTSVSLSRRERATPLREQIEAHIGAGEMIELDFEGVEATQSFVDELIGLLVLERGPEVLQLLRFRRCSLDMKGIINFVVADRASQHARNPHFHAPR